MLLRMAPDGEPLLLAWRNRWRSVCLLALTLLVPVGHFVIFKLTWHSGQYPVGTAPLVQLRLMVGALIGGVGIDYVGPGLLLGLISVLASGFWGRSASLRTIWSHQRGACRAGVALLVGGIVVYLPINGIAGRYTMPAAWGMDLLLAVLIGEVWRLPQIVPRRLTLAALCAGDDRAGGGLPGPTGAFRCQSGCSLAGARTRRA